MKLPTVREEQPSVPLAVVVLLRLLFLTEVSVPVAENKVPLGGRCGSPGRPRGSETTEELAPESLPSEAVTATLSEALEYPQKQNNSSHLLLKIFNI